MAINNKFYLGRIYDSEHGQVTAQPLYYDPDDLTTHAVVVGMTGSGKTGLCLCMLEEAALSNIPALMIDPKGDIANSLLHFPELLPQDFQPWVNPDQARRSSMSVEQAAAQAAASWRKGLFEWNIGPERLRALQDAAHFAVFTPGSDAGIPVSILASLKAPPIPWAANRELLREKISGTVTALLGLVGLEDIDPVRSREHIFLSNIFEHAWSQQRDLDLSELILQTQNPPFAKLGVFDVNTFFPEKERFDLAMQLNNILAAPAFQAWIEGEPLDVPTLLYGADGRPRHSVFYIAHLNDAERMFFVTLLFSAVEAWMRTQSGTPSLRAILYFDEIFGYMPPISNPSSKQPLLRMLKQARAFGVGLVLVTQNPVDVDYKGLSNAGTWFIGKLQTEQDKQRLLDGLQGAMAGNLDRASYDRLISGLNKRVFLLHNVHNPPNVGAQLFQTRWAMNFLAGPLTRVQVPALNRLAGVAARTPAPAPASTTALQPEPDISEPQPVTFARPAVPLTHPLSATSEQQSSASAQRLLTTRPSLPSGIFEYFLPNNLTFTQAFKAAGRPYPEQALSQGLVYHPMVLGQARIRYLNRKYNLDYEQVRTVVVAEPDRRGVIRWENYPAVPIDPQAMDEQPIPNGSFVALEAPFSEAKTMSAIHKDFVDWAYRTSKVTVHANEILKLYAGPEVSSSSFRQMCIQSAREGREGELQKASDTFDRRINLLRDKLLREERELSEDQTELSQRKMEELGTHAENMLGLFGGRRSNRRLSTSLTKRRLTEQAKAEVEESLDALADFKRQAAELEKEKNSTLEEINQHWDAAVSQVSELTITPLKKDILLDLFGVAWIPFHVIQVGNEVIELPGFGQA